MIHIGMRVCAIDGHIIVGRVDTINGIPKFEDF